MDTFAFDDGESSAAAGKHDLVTDFAVGTDLLDLAAIDANATVAGDNAFRFLGTGGFDGQAGALRYSYDASGNVTVVSGDVNGDGAADFAIDLTGNKTLTSAEFVAGSLLAALTLTGTAGTDVLTGGEIGDTLSGLGGGDTLYGNSGNDTLDGGTGADVMVGGAGNDLYAVDDAGDVVTEVQGPFTAPAGWTIKGTSDLDGDGEIDVVVTNGTSNQTWLLKSGVVTAQHDLIANSGPWTLLGLTDADGNGSKEALYLYQSAGFSSQAAMYLNNGAMPGQGNFVAGKQADALVALSGSNQGTDTVQASAGYVLGTGVENLTLIGGAGSIAGTGNAADNVLVGNEGANILAGLGGTDTLTGGDGNDTLNGGTGADVMAGGAGNDMYVADNAGDVATELANEGTDRIESYIANTVMPDNIEIGAIGLATGARLDGNALDNVLQDGAGNDILYGLGGNDTFDGNLGDDTLYGGGGADRVVYAYGDGHDHFIDFSLAEGDTVDLSGTGAVGISNFAQLQSVMSQDVNGVWLTFSADNAVHLHNVTIADLTAQTFSFG